MKITRFLALALVLATSGILFGNRMLGQDNSTSDDLAKAEVKFAQALVKVAEADLAKARDANAQAPDAVPSSVIRGLQNEVTMAKARVTRLNNGDKGENPLVASAKDWVTEAQQYVDQAKEVNAKTPGTYNSAEVARRQALLDLARAKLEVVQLLAKGAPEQQVQWQLMHLGEEVETLRFEVRLLQQHN